MNKPKLFFRLLKVDIAKREVIGIATEEVVDQSGEICDYETTKPYFQAWSDGVKKASGGKSLGNIREMHSNIAAGKITQIEFDDEAKAIRIVTKCVDDSTWNKIQEGVLTGFSQGGDYVRKWKDGEHVRFTADPSEISYVDLPCVQTATFEVIKADGSTEVRKFTPKIEETEAPELAQVWQAKDGSTHATKALAVKHNATIAAKAAVAETLADADALINDIEKDLDKRDNESQTIKKLMLKESWDAARAIEALQIIEGIMCGEEWEKMLGEAVEESQMADLAAAMSRIRAFIAAEIMEDEPEALAAAVKIAVEKLRKEDMEMAAGLMEHVKAIHKSASHIMKKCMKCLGTDAEKILKADDGEDETHNHLKSIHKKAADIAHRAVQMGSDADDEGGASDDESAEKLLKSDIENTELKKSIGTLTTQLAELGKRLKTVEDQPAARKGVTMIVNKGHEREDDEPEQTAVEPQPFNMNGLSPADARSMLQPQRR